LAASVTVDGGEDERWRRLWMAALGRITYYAVLRNHNDEGSGARGTPSTKLSQKYAPYTYVAACTTVRRKPSIKLTKWSNDDLSRRLIREISIIVDANGSDSTMVRATLTTRIILHGTPTRRHKKHLINCAE